MSHPDDVMVQLKEKHPNPQPAKLGSLLFGPIKDAIPETLYSEINGDLWSGKLPCELREQGVHRGSMPTVFIESLLPSLKQSSSRLCEAIATMTKILRTQYVNPSTIEPLIASRPIPLDKGEGAVRSIGVGEVLRP